MPQFQASITIFRHDLQNIYSSDLPKYFNGSTIKHRKSKVCSCFVIVLFFLLVTNYRSFFLLAVKQSVNRGENSQIENQKKLIDKKTSEIEALTKQNNSMRDTIERMDREKVLLNTKLKNALKLNSKAERSPIGYTDTQIYTQVRISKSSHVPSSIYFPFVIVFLATTLQTYLIDVIGYRHSNYSLVENS